MLMSCSLLIAGAGDDNDKEELVALAAGVPSSVTTVVKVLVVMIPGVVQVMMPLVLMAAPAGAATGRSSGRHRDWNRWPCW